MKNLTLECLDENIEFLIDDIEEKMEVSYNRTMLRGCLRYCSDILRKFANGVSINIFLLEKIFDLTRLAEDMCEGNGSFTSTHLEIFKFCFDEIEEESSELGLLPKIDDLTLADVTNE